MAKNRKYSTRTIEGKIRKEYSQWKNMKSRCYSSSNQNMGNYQKMNIKVCERWKISFDNFMDDMGECPKDYTLDRIDPTKDYYLENCRWADWKTQNSNKIDFNRVFEYEGEKLILADWAKKKDINYYTLWGRIYKMRMKFEDAIQKNYFKEYIQYNNEELLIKDFCIKYNIPEIIFKQRKLRNWPIERIVNTPIRNCKNKIMLDKIEEYYK